MHLKELFNFSGRIGRGEFWAVTVPLSVVTVVLFFIGQSVPAILVIGLVPAAWIGLATSVKRLHDIGASGWWVLLNIVPIASLVMFLVLGFKEGDPGANQYGAA